VKNAVFDATHKLTLGWRYTPPNLGQGLYHRLLGPHFMEANPALSRYHAGDVDRYCRGSVVVTRGDTVLARALAVALRVPRASAPGEKGEVEVVTSTAADGSEHWQRSFRLRAGAGGADVVSEFNTRQDICEEQLVETYGPFEYLFDILYPLSRAGGAGDTFVLSLVRFRVGIPGVCMLPLPGLLSPVVTGTTTHRDRTAAGGAGWHFCVNVRGPSWLDRWLGLIFQYEGEICHFEKKL
jgi:hypothetical protein